MYVPYLFKCSVCYASVWKPLYFNLGFVGNLGFRIVLRHYYICVLTVYSVDIMNLYYVTTESM
jgi:hypothetical protein